MASRIQGITVEIGGDTTKLTTALKSVNTDIRATQSQLRDVNNLLKLDPGNTELLAQKHRLLSQAVAETKEKLETLKTVAEQANEALASTLLGENVIESKADDLKAISEKLEVINLQLAQRKTTRKKILHWLLILLCTVIAAILAILWELESSYLGWNYSDPETAVLGVAFHSFEWLFVRAAPIILIGAIIGIFLTRIFLATRTECDLFHRICENHQKQNS